VPTVRRGAALAILAVLLCAGCGGSATGPSPAATPTPTPAAGTPVVLDPGNFDTLVLSSTRPVLVEFQLPT